MAEARSVTTPAPRAPRPDRPRIALLPWGDVIEDYLDGIGLTFEQFRTEMTGGWLFGYIEALRSAGVGTVLYCVSANVRTAERTVHRPSGTPILVLPALAPYRVARRLRPGRASPAHEMPLASRGAAGARRRRGIALRLAQHVAPYFATPYRLLARELRSDGCAAILCQEYENPRFDPLVLLGNQLEVPVFATFQGATWHSSVLERFTRRAALNRSAGVIVAPAAEAARVRSRYHLPAHKVHGIFNPLDVTEWTAAPRVEARTALGIPADARLVVWHGRIEIWAKGLDVLLAAWPRVVARVGNAVDARLLLVGSGRDSATLRARLDAAPVAGLDWRDEYLLDRAELRRYLSAGDVYVFPSRHEGFPVAPVEAMACGIPLVAAAASGVRDIVGEEEAHGAIVVPPDDPVALADALATLLCDSRRCAVMGARARARIEQAFSLQTVGAQLRQVLLGSSRAAAPPAPGVR